MFEAIPLPFWFQFPEVKMMLSSSVRYKIKTCQLKILL